MSRRTPPRTSDTARPVFTQAELAAFMATHKGLYHLEYKHDSWCPAIGTGQGCICQPDVCLRAHDWSLIAEVRG